MTEVSPQDFDLDAWLDGADRPKRGVTVYQKSGLIAELDRLAELIRNADDDEVDGPSMGGGVGGLRAEYASIAAQFHDSALTIQVQSVSQEEQRELREKNPDLDDRALGKLVLSEAFVSPKASPAQVGKLERILGDAQFSLIVSTWHQACRAVPTVSADFLPKPSIQGDGGES